MRPLLLPSLAAALLLTAPVAGAGGGVAGPSLVAPSRDDEPVVVRGAALPELLGTPLPELGAFRYDAQAGGFVPVPFQVDQRVPATFYPGTPWEATELIYDVRGEGSGTLKDVDELAFLFGDGGVRAPAPTPWPAGAGALRYEVEVLDPRPGGGASPPRWIYVFTGAGLARSPTGYVTWTPAPTATMSSARFALEFEGHWIVSGLRIAAGCGSGRDILDRHKGRAMTAGGLGEDEEFWGETSIFLGGLVGPVRAIRVILGAASGVSTTLCDVFSRSAWTREVHLRVHELPEVRLYLDWMPGSGMAFVDANALSTVAVDGVPDPGIGTALPAWFLVRGLDGGAVVLQDFPPSPLVDKVEFFYRDDRTWNDALLTNPGYADADDAAYGAAGLRLVELADSNPDSIPFRMRVVPLCAGEGSAELGAAHAEIERYPLTVAARPERPAGGRIASLTLARAGAALALTWAPNPAAESYRVYGSPHPAAPPTSWTRLGSVAEPHFEDTPPAGNRFYSVVFVSGGVEGGW